MGNNRKSWILGAALAAAAGFATPSLGHADAEVGQESVAASSSDFFAWARPSQAVKLERTVHIGKAPMVRTHGVRIFVPAQHGISAPYLTQVIEEHVRKAAAQQSAEDPFAVEALNVKVRPAGNGFMVSLTSEDVGAAQEVLKRVRARLGE